MTAAQPEARTALIRRLSFSRALPDRPLERWMCLVALGVIGGVAGANVIWTLQTWPMGDVQIYWDAGQRVLAGEPLYPGSSPYTSYRYAPWFAWMWAGFSVLPYWLVAVAWESALLTACAFVAVPFFRRGLYGVAIGGLLVPLLFAVSAGGNVQALLVVSLLYGVDRRSGPMWIAIAASLRATPILFVAVYAARREWGRFWITLGLAAILTGPMLLYNPESLITGVAGREPGLLAESAALYVTVAIVSVAALAVMAWRRSPITILGAAAAAVLASPKLFAYDVTTFLAVPPRVVPSGTNDPYTEADPGQ